MSIRETLRASARVFLRSSAARFGYELRKAPFAGFEPAPIFDLTVQYLMSRRGHSLRFVQVGANDGISGDPLRKYILKFNWRGVLVEPQPEVYAALKANYAALAGRLFFENVAITTRSGEVSMYRAKDNLRAGHGSPLDTSTVASLDPRLASTQLGKEAGDLERIFVPTARLDDLIAKHGLGDLEVLQIDTEGHDWEVLQTLNLAKTRPMVIQFEHGHLSPRDIGSMTEYLNRHDYLVYFGGHQSDSVAMHRKLLEL